MMILQDWNANKNNPKGRIILLLFRLCTLGSRNKFLFIVLIPIIIFYRIFIEWTFGVEIPYKTKIGKGCMLYHGQSLVINDNANIGNNCTLRHSTTIGNKLLSNGSYSQSPVIGNNVDIGFNVCIIGPVIIGNNVKIGAGSVVLKNVPDNTIVAGNPAVIKIKKSENTNIAL